MMNKLSTILRTVTLSAIR